jgi:hypothetical protein
MGGQIDAGSAFALAQSAGATGALALPGANVGGVCGAAGAYYVLRSNRQGREAEANGGAEEAPGASPVLHDVGGVAEDGAAAHFASAAVDEAKPVVEAAEFAYEKMKRAGEYAKKNPTSPLVIAAGVGGAVAGAVAAPAILTAAGLGHAGVIGGVFLSRLDIFGG